MFNFHKLTFPNTGISIVISYRDRYGYSSDSFRFSASTKNLQEKLEEQE